MDSLKDEYQALVDSLKGELPSIPLIMNDLLKIISDSNAALYAVQNIIKNDKSIYSNILKAANSFDNRKGSSERITSISDAIHRVGFEDVKKICINTSIFEVFSQTKTPVEFQIDDLWKHSCGVAIASEALSQRFELKYEKHAYSCGLLHDIGKVAKLKFSEKKFFRELRHASRYDCSVLESEKLLKVLQHDHLGALVIKKWGISSLIEETTRWHHTTVKEKRVEVEDPNLHKLIDIITLANNIIISLDFGYSGYSAKAKLDPEFFRRRKIDSEEFEICVEVVQSALEDAAEHLAIFSKE